MIHLPRAVFHAVRLACEAAYPEEGCGLLIGRKDGDTITVTGMQRSPNTAKKGRRRREFEIDAQVYFRLLRRLRGSRLAVVGHFHSHPDGAPTPSATDLACAFDPELVWLITAVAKGRAAGTAAFRPDGAATCFEPLVLRLTA